MPLRYFDWYRRSFRSVYICMKITGMPGDEGQTRSTRCIKSSMFRYVETFEAISDTSRRVLLGFLNVSLTAVPRFIVHRDNTTGRGCVC